jgi:hypothetical protein
VLQSGTEYDAFRFFTSAPNSPFATFNEADGGTITTGETIVDGVTVPSPSSTLPLAVLALGALALFGRATSARRLRR